MIEGKVIPKFENVELMVAEDNFYTEDGSWLWRDKKTGKIINSYATFYDYCKEGIGYWNLFFNTSQRGDSNCIMPITINGGTIWYDGVCVEYKLNGEIVKQTKGEFLESIKNNG